jgi:mono/diheme cytochrome c family protein
MSKHRDGFGSSTPWLFCAALLCVVAGCGEGPKAEFGWRTSTTELIPAANKAVKQVMTDNFGTPHDLVAWERLPVNYGGLHGTVASKPEGTDFTDGEFAYTLKGEGTVKVKEILTWTSGERMGQTSPVLVSEPSNKDHSWQSLALLKHESVAEGTTFAVNFGEQLQLGRVVYMKNCLHCHGVGGDGNGPTAKYLNPRPRDYRLGIFKFTSTLSAERATRDDLHRIVKYGIPGTYMPSFLLMKENETAAVVEYIRWLTMRGEMEKRLGDELADYNGPSIETASKKAAEEYEAAIKGGEKPEKPVSVGQALSAAVTSFQAYEKGDFPGIIDETADFLAETWQRAEDEGSLITPKVARVADTLESRQRGRLLYMSNRTKCYTCHGPLGRGDGGAVDDFWPKPGTNEKYAHRGLHDLWGQKLQPRDLTKGQYRGGRRPLDLYRRIFAGIKGTPMPAFGGTVLKDEEIWDLVNYVMHLPFESPAPSSTRSPAMASVPPQPEQDH